MTLPQALLIDMDGTLVDSEPFWEAAKINLATRFGIPFTAEDAAVLVGKSMMVTVEAMQAAGVPLGEEEILADLVDEVANRVGESIPWLPGAQDFLARAAAAGIPCALVTQAWAPVARHVVEQSNGALQAMVSGGDVSHPKPHPEPYLLGAEKLGVDPTRCVALEDSPSGVASAEAAGAQVIVLPGILPVEPSPNRHPINSMENVTIEMLERLSSGDA